MEDIKPYSTLFLDRDGVINVHRPDDYVKSVDEFIFLPGVLEALNKLSALFRYIFIVTNQRGVGKGIMSVDCLKEIHNYMLMEIEKSGGRIDKIYTCTAVDTEDPCRKPNPGMGLQALGDFPEINLSKSWMAGDSLSDMEFAKNLGIPGILIGNGKLTGTCVSAMFPDLLTFANHLVTIQKK